MNWVDVLIVAFVIVAAIRGWFQGPFDRSSAGLAHRGLLPRHRDRAVAVHDYLALVVAPVIALAIVVVAAYAGHLLGHCSAVDSSHRENGEARSRRLRRRRGGRRRGGARHVCWWRPCGRDVVVLAASGIQGSRSSTTLTSRCRPFLRRRRSSRRCFETRTSRACSRASSRDDSIVGFGTKARKEHVVAAFTESDRQGPRDGCPDTHEEPHSSSRRTWS